MLLQAFFLKFLYKTIYTFTSLPLSSGQRRRDKCHISVSQIKQMPGHHFSHYCIILINGIYRSSFLFVTDDNKRNRLCQLFHLL